MRIAIGTSDRINTEHFGRAKGFIIYQWNGDEASRAKKQDSVCCT